MHGAYFKCQRATNKQKKEFWSFLLYKNRLLIVSNHIKGTLRQLRMKIMTYFRLYQQIEESQLFLQKSQKLKAFWQIWSIYTITQACQLAKKGRQFTHWEPNGWTNIYHGFMWVFFATKSTSLLNSSSILWPTSLILSTTPPLPYNQIVLEIGLDKKYAEFSYLFSFVSFPFEEKMFKLHFESSPE